jgi:hypothetical protein
MTSSSSTAASSSTWWARESRSPAEQELLASTLLRSQTLPALHEAVRRDEIPPDVALDRLVRLWATPIRLLGHAVLRRRAWGTSPTSLGDLAHKLGGPSDAEYVALTQLQADAFVTPWTRTWCAEWKAPSPRRRSRPCKRPDASPHRGPATRRQLGVLARIDATVSGRRQAQFPHARTRWVPRLRPVRLR